MKLKTVLIYIGGFFVGLVNGLLGAGGGMLAVPLLKKLSLDDKEAHSSSIAVILPLSVLSALLYLWQGTVSIKSALPYIPFGIVGAVAGALLLKKLPDVWIRRIFGVFLLYAAGRIFFA